MLGHADFRNLTLSDVLGSKRGVHKLDPDTFVYDVEWMNGYYHRFSKSGVEALYGKETGISPVRFSAGVATERSWHSQLNFFETGNWPTDLREKEFKKVEQGENRFGKFLKAFGFELDAKASVEALLDCARANLDAFVLRKGSEREIKESWFREWLDEKGLFSGPEHKQGLSGIRDFLVYEAVSVNRQLTSLEVWDLESAIGNMDGIVGYEDSQKIEQFREEELANMRRDPMMWLLRQHPKPPAREDFEVAQNVGVLQG